MSSQGKSKHRMGPSNSKPALLECRYCGMQTTVGGEIGQDPPKSSWCRFPGREWTKCGKGKGAEPMPECPKPELGPRAS